MAITKSKCFQLLLVLALVMLQASECKAKTYNRKEMGLKSGGPAAMFPSLGNYKEMPEDWEMRRVPAGPDPLHHNGHTPTKPRTP
ncbi:Hypothetical predicted protein [Olea europaea subsp. europaea]|uniref:Uncharacterized protein n=1 Tax=Olea europaea subsp. europaea TaxID=158383 RepID=A0A8S0TXJ1_OLEEU|nr:Hypothetical predicted protein [Olea europaea subsp. europaea]